MASVNYKQNKLKKLRAFCQTAKLGSVTKAAESLYASQPTISLQIQALEREIGAQLFERRGPNLKLTVEGEILWNLAQPLVQGIDHLQETFEAHCGNLTTGELTIAAGESTILYVLPEPIRIFAEQYPGIRLRLANVTGRDGLELLLRDEADLAVGSMLDIPADIEYHPFVTYHPVLITPKDHPLARKRKLTLQDIGEYGLILPPRHLSTWRIVKMIFAQHSVSFNVALEAGGWEVIKRYVKLGMGVSIVTDVCITDTDREELAVIDISQYFPHRSYGVVTRKGRFLAAPARRFIDIVNECFEHRPDAVA